MNLCQNTVMKLVFRDWFIYLKYETIMFFINEKRNRMNAAVIVLFNSELERLKQNVDAIKNQVDKVIFVDNGDIFCSEVLVKQFGLNNKYIYINNEGNKGIAFALNRAIEYCIKNKVKWLLTLDQDSVSPSNLISSYEQYTAISNVAIVCCSVNYNEQEIITATKNDERCTFVSECITSASYIRVDICNKLGGFDENMFIDRVDFEYCYRVMKLGFKILQTNEVVLSHRLGNLKLKKIGEKKVHVGGHSAFRKFYMAQNLIYCRKKHPDIYSIRYCAFKELKLILKTIIYEDKKIIKLKAIFKGIDSGLRMKCSEDNWLSV